MRCLGLLVSGLTVLLMNIDNQAAEPKHWLPAGQLAHPLHAAEMPKVGTELVKRVFASSGDPTKALAALADAPTDALNELRALASGLSLQERKPQKDTQAKGRSRAGSIPAQVQKPHLLAPSAACCAAGKAAPLRSA
jgi:hypothetical protein